MPDLFQLWGDQMKKALRLVFENHGEALPDPLTFECLARIGVGTIDHEHQPFNTTSFVGTAYFLLYTYDDPASPHYADVRGLLDACRAAGAAAAGAAAPTHALTKGMGLAKLAQI